MACYHPVKGYFRQDGRFTQNARYGIRDGVIPCGGCVGCRLRKGGEWAVRGTHEASMHLFNSFVTLTYDSKRLPDRPIGHLPADVGLYYPDFQKFMKDLRDRFGPGVRFMVSGEYGDKLGRPHFHAILFNCHFGDRRKWYKTKQGHQVYRSALLEQLWPWGNSDIGSVTPHSIAYVARYIMKKVNGNSSKSHYRVIDSDTGEILGYREPEFAEYSTHPGIGRPWFDKFYSSVYPHDYIVFNGRKVRPPRYYDKLYERMTTIPVELPVRFNNSSLDHFDLSEFSPQFDAIKESRVEVAQKFLDDNSPERLLVREQVAQAKVSSLPRQLK